MKNVVTACVVQGRFSLFRKIENNKIIEFLEFGNKDRIT